METELTTRHNLPSQPTSFIGRKAEIAEITSLLDDPACRLVTLAGPGGIGKTRLAIEVAARKLDAFPNGIFFVPLQPLFSHENIVFAIADAINIQFFDSDNPTQQLLKYLGERHILLLMDNFEHLLAGVDLLSSALAAAPDVKVLVTSREALNLREEWVCRLEGMNTPTQVDHGNLEDYDAVRLFVERARQVNQRFSLDDEQQDIVHICQLVEGMPLAIELAASWLKTLSCDEIAAEIQNSLDILETPLRNVPERHRSMQAVFDWSWDSLTDKEQAVFGRLSVFRGGCRREAAQAVTGADLRTLQALVDKSFIRRDLESGRYDVHELMRQYGEAQLEATGQFDAVHDAHMHYYADALSQREADLKGPRQVEALDDIEYDFENVRAAWDWAVGQRNAAILNQMMETLTLLCEIRTRHHEGLDLLQSALDELAEVSGEPFRSLRWWLKLFWLHLWQLREHSVESIRLQIEEVLAVAHQREDQAMMASCLYELGEYVRFTGSFREALPIYEEALAHYRDLRDGFNAVRVLRGIAICYYCLGDEYLDEQVRSHREHLDLAREVGVATGLGHAIYDDAELILRTQQDCAAYERRLQEAHDLWESVGNRTYAGVAKVDLARIAVLDRGDFDRAGELIEEAAQIAEDANYIVLKVFVLLASGFLAIMEEDYTRSEQLLTEALAIGDPFYTPSAHVRLAVSYLGQENYEGARRHFYYALRSPRTQESTQRIVLATQIGALFLAQEGQNARAVELLGSAFMRRDTVDFWLWSEQTPLYIRWHAALKAELGEEAYRAAIERGKVLDLEAVFHELLEELSPDDMVEAAFPAHVLAANERLPEPLTDRELEVLSLLAEGLSNHEIAGTLVISLHTVKHHVAHILAKMTVSTRTQAAVKARNLGIIR